jgi:hypothetical protein
MDGSAVPSIDLGQCGPMPSADGDHQGRIARLPVFDHHLEFEAGASSEDLW